MTTAELKMEQTHRNWPSGATALAVAGLTVVLTGLVVARYREWPLLALVVGVIVVVGGYLAYVDFQEHRLPNVVTGPIALFSTFGLAACGFIYGFEGQILPAIGFGLGSFVFFFIMHLMFNLGMGDVKYAYTLGVTTGWFSLSTLLTAFAITTISAAAAAVIAMVVSRNKKRYIAYGPYMSLGIAVSLLTV